MLQERWKLGMIYIKDYLKGIHLSGKTRQKAFHMCSCDSICVFVCMQVRVRLNFVGLPLSGQIGIMFNREGCTCLCRECYGVWVCVYV